jgi:hypothetical protein
METFMSKGPGRVSRAIEAALEAEPDNAFTVEDLCDRVYRGINRVEKKHRVAVLRAAPLRQSCGPRSATKDAASWSLPAAHGGVTCKSA